MIKKPLRLLALLVAAVVGCQTAGKSGIKITAAQDVNRGTWAKPRDHFTSGDTPVIRVFGYGGQKVTLELWEEIRGLVNKKSATIPRTVTQVSDEGIVFQEKFGRMAPVHSEKFTRTTTDWMVQLKSLPPGRYEVRLLAEDGRHDAARFSIENE